MVYYREIICGSQREGICSSEAEKGRVSCNTVPGGDFSKLAAFVLGKSSFFAHERAFVSSL